MAATNLYVSEAKSLIREALRDYDEERGFGTMSCAVYDTAWVSLVTKFVDGQEMWLFPQTFEYLLRTQSEDGGWSVGSASQIDGILNTAASLLALERHCSKPLQLQYEVADLRSRIRRGAASLKAQLASWDVSTTHHVGFEIIVPAMLNFLEKEDASLLFNFEGRALLMKIHATKMSRFKPEYLYGTGRMTALHSLEALIGKLDFDKVTHHKVQGSMLGSPSSTAAYLMEASQWDTESEAYLRHVIQFGSGRGSGGVPSAFPSTNFESSWILSTLLTAGFSPAELSSPELNKMTDILRRQFDLEGGVVGFAPFFEADVDDTAKTITSLTILGQPVKPNKMLEVFEADSHFRTYVGERDPSFTANCNALMALLHQSDPGLYSSQIFKTTKFLCDQWWNADGRIEDKWNTCYLYPSVLIVETLVHLVALLEQFKLPEITSQDMRSRVAITLFQACLRPLLDQEKDGSWNHSSEETAYGILILAQARRVSFFQELTQPLNSAIERGVNFLQSAVDMPPSYIWIEKVTYASPLLTNAYVLAALKAASLPPSEMVGSSLSHGVSSSRMNKHVKLFHQAELFNTLPEWELQASMIEAALFLPALRDRRLDIFPRTDVEDDDTYFDVIPFFWTSSNNRARVYASTTFLYEMTTIAMLNFQLDEFMEATAGPVYQGHMAELQQLIRRILPDDGPARLDGLSSVNGHDSIKDSTNETNSVSGTGPVNPEGVKEAAHGVVSTPEWREQQVYPALSRFLRHIMWHPSVQSASAWDQHILKRELRNYLAAHAQQAEDSKGREGEEQNGATKQRPKSKNTFFGWVRSTSADHISCPYSFAFVSCLIGSSLTPGSGGGDCFHSAGEKYVAMALCRHLATMCRMYNDIGSAERDHDEGNLNSVDFPEFDVHADIVSKKMALLRVGEYERSCMLEALAQLKRERRAAAIELNDAEATRLGERRMAIWSMFSEEVDLYGQVYVVRDLSSRMVMAGGEHHVSMMS